MTGQRRRIWAAIAAVAATSLLAVLLVVVATNRTAERVSANAALLHRTNATLGTTALARAAAGQVAIFEDLVASGDATTDSLTEARREMRSVKEGLVSLMVASDEPAGELVQEFGRALTQQPLDMEAVEAAYVPLRLALVEEIESIEATIEGSEAAAARLYTFVRVAVLLIIPVGVIILYRRRAAAQVREAQIEMNAALEAEREIARAKGDFVAGLSHEMKTPLTGIYGFSQVLLDTVDDEAVRSMVEEIHAQSADLARMIDDFITMTRLDSETAVIESEPVDVVDVVRSVVDALGPLDHDITVNGADALAAADRDKVRHILTNLVSNAVRYGGPNVLVEVHQANGTVVCEVVDDGEQIPESTQAKLFTRYINDGADVLTAGSHGLGTWVAAQLADRMGGSLAYDRCGQETVFTLRLRSAAIDQDIDESAALVAS